MEHQEDIVSQNLLHSYVHVGNPEILQTISSPARNICHINGNLAANGDSELVTSFRSDIKDCRHLET